MKKLEFKSATYLKSALASNSWPDLKDPSGKTMKEIVISGRSNVGKSSLLNNLFRQKKLAKVSATPGKTNTLNFFIVDNEIALVDLPGYGYAKVSKELKETWSFHLDEYLKNRQQISLFLILIDIRRLLTKEDIAFIEWSLYHQKPILVIFTKCDKVNEDEKRASTEKNLKMLEPLTVETCTYSINDPKARGRLIETINRMI